MSGLVGMLTIAIHKQVMMIHAFYIACNGLYPINRCRQFVASFPCENGWIVLIRNPSIHIDVIEENTDILLKITDNLGIRVECLLITNTTPICKSMFTAVIVTPIVGERNDQANVMLTC